MPRSTINGTAIDLDGKEMILDADQDTTLTVDTDDQVDIKIAGNDQVVITTGSTAFKAPDGGNRYALNGMGNSNSAELSLYDSSDAQKVRIGAGADTFFNYGKVGIGTTSPSTPLHVVGNNGILVDDSGNGDGQIYFGGISGSDRTYLARSSDDFLIWNVANGTMKFGTNNSERLRILAGGGITFNGDTADANALDDYEEGTFTASFNGSTSNPTISYSAQVGTYVKVGKLVQITVSVIASGTPSGGGGNLRISGLPFTSKSGVQQAGTVAFTNTLSATSGTTQMSCNIEESDSVIHINEHEYSGTSSMSRMQVSALHNSSPRIVCSICYEVA